MLDEVVSKEGPKPKVVTQSGGVGTTGRHLSQEDLDAYMNGRLASARMDSCGTHLESCDACRAELEDLRTFKSNAASMSQNGSLTRELDRRKRQRQLETVAQVGTVTVVVAVVVAVGWWKFGKARAPGAAVAVPTATVAHAPSPALAVSRAPASTQAAPAVVAPPTPTTSRDMRSAGGQPHAASTSPGTAAPARDARSANAKARASTTTAAQTVVQAPGASTPAPGSSAVARASAPAAPAVAAATPPADRSFALLGPFGDEISDPRPEFTWQPLPGASKYSVVIVDESLHPVQHSHGVKTTSWRPRSPLRRGHSYLWQVTATVKSGSKTLKIVAKAPTSLEARIRIAPTAGQARGQ